MSKLMLNVILLVVAAVICGVVLAEIVPHRSTPLEATTNPSMAGRTLKP